MNNFFDELAVRDTFGNMKLLTTPQAVTDQRGITFSGAEMDFKTAPAVIHALKRRAENGLYGYTLADVEYIEAIQYWMNKRRAWQVDANWIVPTNGTLHSIGTALRAFTQKGAGVIIHDPVYMLYERVIESNERVVVRNKLIYRDGEYDIDFAQLEVQMSMPSTKVLLLCNPHNPISKVWNESYVKAIVELGRKHNVLIISDEIFAEITFGSHKTPPLLQCGKVTDQLITITSIGKTFNFTGFSHANLIIANEQVRESFLAQRRIDHYGSLNPFIRDAVIAAYRDGEAWFDEMLSYVETNIKMLESYVSKNFPRLKLCKLEGTYLAWIDWSSLNMTEEQLDAFLIEEAGIQFDVGTHFGKEGLGFTRVNLATPSNILMDALERLKVAWERHSLTTI